MRRPFKLAERLMLVGVRELIGSEAGVSYALACRSLFVGQGLWGNLYPYVLLSKARGKWFHDFLLHVSNKDMAIRLHFEGVRQKGQSIICATNLLVVSRPYSRIETKKSIDLLINFIDHIQEYLFSNVDSIFTKDMRK